MNLLLDTHALLWWLAGTELDEVATDAIADPANLVYVSAASIWEISIKRALGKLTVDGSISAAATENGFTPLPVDAAHAEAVAQLPDLHRDPFDRMLVAQALHERLTIVSRDVAVAAYDVPVLTC